MTTSNYRNSNSQDLEAQLPQMKTVAPRTNWLGCLQDRTRYLAIAIMIFCTAIIAVTVLMSTTSSSHRRLPGLLGADHNSLELTDEDQDEAQAYRLAHIGLFEADDNEMQCDDQEPLYEENNIVLGSLFQQLEAEVDATKWGGELVGAEVELEEASPDAAVQPAPVAPAKPEINVMKITRPRSRSINTDVPSRCAITRQIKDTKVPSSAHHADKPQNNMGAISENAVVNNTMPAGFKEGFHLKKAYVAPHLVDFRLCKTNKEIDERFDYEKESRDSRKPDAVTLQSGPARIQVQGASPKVDGYYKKMAAIEGPPAKFYETHPVNRRNYWTQWTNSRAWYEQVGGAHWIRYHDDNTGTITWDLETADFTTLYESDVTGDSHDPTKAKWRSKDKSPTQMKVTAVSN